jgi:alpha-glucosidase (family GH31 glycosyl hydrolase)
MLLPVAFLHEDDWARDDAWMLGEALLVAPVLEAGATGRDVHLPQDVRWYDWWTGEPVQTGFFAAATDQIPVFAAGGTTLPTLGALPAVGGPSFADVDGERVVWLFDGGGPFAEADGTIYVPRGRPDGTGEATATFARGTVEVAGLAVDIAGPVTRTYTIRIR